MDNHDGMGRYVRARREWLGLSMTDLARQADLSKSELSALEAGKVKLPGADKRRRLAYILRVRHLDLLIAAGELAPEEISGVAVAPATFPDNSPAAKVVEILHHLPDEHAGWVLGMARFAERRARGESDEEEEPIVRVGTTRKVG